MKKFTDFIKLVAAVIGIYIAGLTPVTHQVQKGETYYSLAGEYNVCVFDLQKRNPQFPATDIPIGAIVEIKKEFNPLKKLASCSI